MENYCKKIGKFQAIMLQKNFFYRICVIFFLISLCACEENGAQQPRMYVRENVDNRELSGHWWCSDFLDMVSLRRSVRSVGTRPVFIEMVFKPEYKDSVLLITGYENIVAHYETIGKDSLALKDLLPGKILLIVPVPGTDELLVTDSAPGSPTEKPQAWTFTKAPDNVTPDKYDGKSVIYSAINKSLIAGEYTIPNNPNSKISFNENGTVSGWDAYSRYSICKGGLCFQNTPAVFDIIEATGSNGTDYYGGILGDSLLLYPLQQQNTNKGMVYKQTGQPLVFKK